ncbi:hypothetical protein [Streptomyces sp. NPDC059455]|uniref:hypothetical protein n=1 Tax=Streptomyces sp. NPDC059455 TaxID=3346837 RepID=UPI003683835A
MSSFSSLGPFLPAATTCPSRGARPRRGAVGTAKPLARYHPTAEITAPLSRFAGLYDTSRCVRLLGFSPAHRWRTADAVTKDPH